MTSIRMTMEELQSVAHQFIAAHGIDMWVEVAQGFNVESGCLTIEDEDLLTKVQSFDSTIEPPAPPVVRTPAERLEILEALALATCAGFYTGSGNNRKWYPYYRHGEISGTKRSKNFWAASVDPQRYEIMEEPTLQAFRDATTPSEDS